MHSWSQGLAGFLLVAVVGCASVGPPPFRDPKAAKKESVTRIEDLQLRGLLLLLADRRIYEPYAVNAALEGGTEVRESLAVTLGRVGLRPGQPILLELLEDPAPRVRRAAAFALGETGFRASAEAVLRHVKDSDRETGTLAVEALGKLGVSVLQVGEALADLGEAEFWPRLLPSLYHYQEEAMIPLALLGLEKVEDSRLRSLAAYALAREAFPGTLEDLRSLLSDQDPWVRSLGARGLGKLGEARAIDSLFPLLQDTFPGPVVQALRAAGRLVSEGALAAPETWRTEILRLFRDDRPVVRQTAIEVSWAWLLDEDLGAALVAIAADSKDSLGPAALLSLAKAAHPQATGLVARSLASTDPLFRARGVEAASLLGLWSVVEHGLNDVDPRVRAAVFRVCLAAGEACSRDSEPLARQGLSDPDVGVRSVVFEALATHPLLSTEDLLWAWANSSKDREEASRMAGIKALVARGKRAPSEEAKVVEALLQLARDRRRLVRRQAVKGLRDLGHQAPSIGPLESQRPAEAYEDALLRSLRPRRITIATDRGDLEVELACPEAPMTCLSFLQLAEQGFYDGLSFHRVLPDFVVQSGDPREDGLGGPGYTLRDEINRIRFDRGVLGMAISSPDTAGSQFFLTLSPQPHLDGEYTALGRVVAGDEVLDLLVEGDLLHQITLQH